MDIFEKGVAILFGISRAPCRSQKVHHFVICSIIQLWLEKPGTPFAKIFDRIENIPLMQLILPNEISCI